MKLVTCLHQPRCHLGGQDQGAGPFRVPSEAKLTRWTSEGAHVYSRVVQKTGASYVDSPQQGIAQSKTELQKTFLTEIYEKEGQVSSIPTSSLSFLVLCDLDNLLENIGFMQNPDM